MTRDSYITLNAGDPANEFRMHYKLAGDAGKPALVLTPGIGAGMSSWTLMAGRFKDFRVLTYDPRGMYKSGKTPDYEFSRLASDLNELLMHLGIERADILGWSMGGIVAQYFASIYPEKVSRLILVSTFTMGPDPVSTEMYARIGRNLVSYAGAEMSDPPTTDELRQFMRALTGLSFNKRLLRGIVVAFAKVAASGSVSRRLHGFFDGLNQEMSAIENSDSYSLLDRITAPTLLIHGTDDRLIPFECRQIIEDALVNADVTAVDIPGGSHACAIESPKKVAALINGFLKPH